ncbi:MAG: PfkB family carbohydrate kinase, partial [Oscillospiraceae bacterium]
VSPYKVEAVDTLGAGDSFFGAFLSKIAKAGKSLEEFDMEDLKEFALYANACGSLSSAKAGAIPAMPTEEEVMELCKNGTMLS